MCLWALPRATGWGSCPHLDAIRAGSSWLRLLQAAAEPLRNLNQSPAAPPWARPSHWPVLSGSELCASCRALPVLPSLAGGISRLAVFVLTFLLAAPRAFSRSASLGCVPCAGAPLLASSGPSETRALGPCGPASGPRPRGPASQKSTGESSLLHSDPDSPAGPRRPLAGPLD